MFTVRFCLGPGGSELLTSLGMESTGKLNSLWIQNVVVGDPD